MRTFLRLVVATMFAASGLIVTAVASDAQVTVVECDPSPVANPGVTIPSTVPVLGGVEVLGDEDPCLEGVRTLVFVGFAAIPDAGVNFAGTGNGAAGGGFDYTGQCVMVNWTTPANSSAPVNPLVTDCTFNTTNGEYHDPTSPNPVINPIGAALETNCTATADGYCGLDWAPADQASCINSSGSGTSSFTSRAPVQALGGSSETWAAGYKWENSLDNLRGDPATAGQGIWNTAAPGTVYAFDAKIETQANPTAGPPLDRTAVGCLEKTLNALTDTASDASTGLNSVLVAGTATWRSVIPTIL